MLIKEPHPARILQAIAATLRDEVTPLLANAGVRSQLETAIGLLDYVGTNLDTAVPELSAEIDELRDVLTGVGGALRDHGRVDLAVAVADLVAVQPGLSLSELLEYTDQLQRQVLAVFLAVEDAGAETGPLGAIRPPLLATMAAINARRNTGPQW